MRKKICIMMLMLVVAASAHAQLISEKTDSKLTVNLDVFHDFQLKPNDNWKAGKFNPGFATALTYNLPLGNSKSHKVAMGLGISTHNYYSSSVIENPYASTLTFTQHAGDEHFKRYKVNPTYAEIPMELRFRFNDAWKIGVGFKFGILLSAKTKYVHNTMLGENADNKVKVTEKYCNIKNIERYSYAATLRVGYKWVSAYASLQLSRVFTAGTNGPEIMPFTVGLSFAPF